MADILRAAVPLLKFRYHVTFANVVFGAALFATELGPGLLLDLALLYVSFNVLLYGGIYTLNDIADRAADGRHPRKRDRPIAAGRVSVFAASAFGGSLVALGMLSGLVLFGPAIDACYVAVIACNAIYSLKARNVAYADVLFNSLTHPMRFLMGAMLAGRTPPAGHLLSLLLLAMVLSCLRRIVERDSPGWDARETLTRYTPGELSALAFGCASALVVVAAIQAPLAPGFYAILLMATAILAGGGWWSPPVRSSLRTIWTQ
jgi:decaprenyl-phosphate phosphoribosyltransferase